MSLTAGGVEPEFSTVFASGSGTYDTYRIPALAVTTNGTLLAFCEGRKRGRDDAGAIDLLLKRSTDGGTTWGPLQIVRADSTNTCGNPTPVVDRATGAVWLLMTWNNGADKEAQIARRESRDTRRVFVTHSADDGVTWTAPEEITAAVKPTNWTWYATGPGGGIQVLHGAHRGRLVIPCNHDELDAQGAVVWRSHVIFSDDDGATWHLGGSEADDTNESTITELADDTLMHNMRTSAKYHRRAVATSANGGMTWSPVRYDDALIEPVCEGNILRYTWPENGEKSRILFSNPASLKREKLTVRVSYDEGVTWSAGKMLYAGPSAYSCLAVLPDKSIGCLFECGETNAYQRISLARFSAGWVEDGMGK